MPSSSQRPTKKARTTTSSRSKDERSSSSSCVWRESECGTLLYLHDDDREHNDPNNNGVGVVGFDLDDTLIRTKSGKTFATNDLTDWRLWADGETVMRPAMKRLVDPEDGAEKRRVVIFTNQEGVGKGKVDRSKWQTKVENVIEALGLEKGRATVLASLSKKGNDYRKPHVGMWRFLREKLSDAGVAVDVEKSLYVGDAAGRPKRGAVKKDFSCTDYKFALNVGLSFQTPEQFFLGSEKSSDAASPETSNMGFRPRSHWREHYEREELSCPTETATDRLLRSCRDRADVGPEVIVMVGSPASGKSHAATRVVDGTDGDYVRVNQDTLKTLAKCLRATERALADGKSVVVDNTNRDVATRAKYVNVAEKNDAVCRCAWIQTTKEESFHLNALRGAVGAADGGDRRTVPDVVVHGYYKNLAEPSAAKEGFREVVEIPFVPGPFPSVERKEAFFRFTT